MKKITTCKNCGKNILSNVEICDDCKKNHNISKFLKKLIDFLGEDLSFDDTDFEKIGVEEHIAYEYIWELSKLNMISLHQSNYILNNDSVDEFIKHYYLGQNEDSDIPSVIKIDGKDYEVYDPTKVKIANNSNYKKDIQNLVKNIEFIEESSNIPFPQADDLNRFIFICQHLLEKDLSKDEIKEINQIHNRIVNMYTRTGFYFGIFDEYKNKNNIYYKLTIKGKSIFELDEYNRNIGICHCILEHEIFYRIFNRCLKDKEIKSDSIIRIMNQYDLKLNSEVTLKRRAGCVSSWMHWIFKLMYPDKNFK